MTSSLKIVPYVPRTTKPKPKSKAKPIADHNRSGVSSKDDGEWFHIDDFQMPNSNALCALDPIVPALFGAADASSSPPYDVVSGLCAATKSESVRDLLDNGEADHATSVTEADLDVSRLLHECSRRFLQSLKREADCSTTHVEPSNSGQTAASTGGYSADQNSNLHAASMRAVSEEDIEGISHELSPTEDEQPFGDVDVASGSPLTGNCKRAHPSELELEDPYLELEDPYLAKRQRPSALQAKSFIADHMNTPKPMPLRNPSSDSLPRASNEPSPGPLDSDNDYTRSLMQNDLLDSDSSDNGGYTIDKELSESERGRGSEIGDSDEEELNWRAGKAQAPTTTFQHHNVGNRPLQDGQRSPRQHTKQQSQNSKPTGRTLRRPKSFKAIATQSTSLRTSSEGTRAAVHGRRSSSDIPSNHVGYEATDITFSQLPKNATTLMTAIVRCHETTSGMSGLALKSLTVVHNMLGDTGQLIRIMQLTSDSWLVVGCQYSDALSGPGPTQGSNDCAPWTDTYNLHRNSTNYNDSRPDKNENNRDDDFENCGSSRRDSNAGNMDNNGAENPYGEPRHTRVRTRAPWSKSDEQRLLAYKCKMSMEWEEIFPQFPNRTPGAVRARWHALQGK